MSPILGPPPRQMIKAPPEDPETRYIRGILSQHENKDFVQRILNPKKYPSIPAEGGKRATHKMMWGEADGKFFVYPSIIHKKGKLVDLGVKSNKAMEHALTSGEYIRFSTAKEAEQFSKGYKKVWPKQDQ